MKKSTKIAAIALSLLTLSGGAAVALPATFAQAEASRVQQTTMIRKTNNSTKSVDANIERPTCTYTIYNTAVVYDWYVGQGGDEVVLYDLVAKYHTGQAYYRDIKMPYYTNTRNCDPRYFSAYSYSSETQKYSGEYTLEHETDSATRYGYDCDYTIRGLVTHDWVSGNSMVPTTYDQSHFLWDHNTPVGHKIKGTIIYNGQIANIETSVPFLGYSTGSATVNGVTFYLRSGPWKCSLIASSSNVFVGDINFAYGTT